MQYSVQIAVSRKKKKGVRHDETGYKVTHSRLDLRKKKEKKERKKHRQGISGN
jgi:hypothetical protein